MRLHIRSAVPTDIPYIYAISMRAHQESYASLIPPSELDRFTKRFTESDEGFDEYKTRLMANIQDPHWFVLVAERNGKVVGYTRGEQISECLIQKKGLFVDPDHYSQGIGGQLFDASMMNVKKGTVIRLFVIENNERAKQLYKKRGFKEVGVAEKPFFGAKEVVMEYTVN